MKVRFAAAAEGDLESIGDYVAKDDPERALALLAELRAACRNLAEFPRRFPQVPRYTKHEVRRCVHENYVIFYRMEIDAQVTVIHILHGARDLEAILFGE